MHFRGCAAIEPLESRRLLSVSVAAKKATLNIVGTAGDDKIRVTAHRSLINFVNFVVKNAAGREDVFVATGRFATIRVDAMGGNDEILIDNSLRGLAPDVSVWLDGGAGDDRVLSCPLPGTIAMRDGNDLVKLTSSEPLVIYGDAGNDRLEVGTGRHVLDGGDGNDTLVAGDGAHLLLGGGGDDNVRASAYLNSVRGGGGNDQIFLTAFGKARAVSNVHGDRGNDTLKGSAAADELHGDAGNDVLIAGGGRGDTLYGDAGDDVLDAGGSDAARLFGGDGNDDLYAGDATIGVGGEGDDWFEKAAWASTDQTKEEFTLVVVPNTGSYGSASRLFLSGGTMYVGTGAVAYTSRTIYLQRVDDVGFVASADDGEIPSTSRSLGNFAAGESARLSPTLTKGERKAARVGIVRLPAGWKVVPAVAVHDGAFVWYDVRFGKGGDLAKTSEFGTVYQLCVKAGTIVVTADGGYTTAAGRIARAPSDTLAMSLPAGGVARIAGETTAHPISGDVLDAANVKVPKGRHGILVEDGVIWLAAGDAATTFIAG